MKKQLIVADNQDKTSDIKGSQNSNAKSGDIDLDEGEYDDMFAVEEIPKVDISKLLKEKEEREAKIKEMMSANELLGKKIEKEGKVSEKKAAFNLARLKFVLKVDFDSGEFKEYRIKKYVAGIVSICGKNMKKDIKIVSWKCINEYVYFKLSYAIKLPWLTKEVKAKGDFEGFYLTQLRPEMFFDDLE